MVAGCAKRAQTLARFCLVCGRKDAAVTHIDWRAQWPFDDRAEYRNRCWCSWHRRNDLSKCVPIAFLPNWFELPTCFVPVLAIKDAWTASVRPDCISLCL